MQQKTRSRGEKIPSRTAPQAFGTSFPEEGILVCLILEENKFREQALSTLSLEDFHHPSTRQIFQALAETEDLSSLAYSQLINRFDESVKSFVASHSMGELTPQEKEKAFLDCLGKIKRRRKDERLGRLRRAISAAEGSGEENQVSKLLEEYRSLLTERS